MQQRNKSFAACLTRSLHAAATAVGFLALVACATTQLKDEWRDPSYRAAAPQRILVIAVVGRDERRRSLEEQLVARLGKAGVDAVVSYPRLSVAGPEDLAAVRRAVEQSGASLVLTVRLRQVTEETRISGGYSGPPGFYGYFPQARSGMLYSRPEAYTAKGFLTETRVFDIKSDRAVWSALLESELPNDFSAAAEQYADLVVKQMQSSDILAAR